MLILTKDKVRYECAQHIYVNEEASSPPPGTQIFCGNLPRSMREIELFPYFSLIGEIYEFRLMMEFSGFSRGFCFVTYMKVEQAEQAISTLHGYVLKDRQLAVYKSWNNTRLFIYGIPPSVTPTQVRDEFKAYFPGIVNVLCKAAGDNKSLHRGWAFLEFDNHRNASMCRKRIWPNKFKAWGSVIRVEWARPARSANLRELCTLVLRNVPPHYNRGELYHALRNRLGGRTLMQIQKPIGSAIASLEFHSPSAANIVLEALQGFRINGFKIDACKYSSTKYSGRSTSSSSGCDQNSPAGKTAQFDESWDHFQPKMIPASRTSVENTSVRGQRQRTSTSRDYQVRHHKCD